MALNWYVEREGEHFGPYSQDHFLRLLRSGGIEGMHRVRRADRHIWVPASQMSEVYPELAPLLAGIAALAPERATGGPPPSPGFSFSDERSGEPPEAAEQTDAPPEAPPTSEEEFAAEPPVLGVLAFAVAVAIATAGLVAMARQAETGPLLVIVAASLCGIAFGGLGLMSTDRPRLIAWLGLAGNLVVGGGLSATLVAQMSLPSSPLDLDPRVQAHNAFQSAILAGDVDHAKELAVASPWLLKNPDGKNSHLLAVLVAQHGAPRAIEYLGREAGADPNVLVEFPHEGQTYFQATPLLIALLVSHPAAVEPLLQLNSDPGLGESPATTPLGIAVGRRDFSLTKRLAERGGERVEDALDELLVQVASEGDGAYARLLLTLGAEPNLVTPEGTALQAAIARGDVALVKALLEYGANPNLYSAAGGDVTTMLPPLHRAVKFQQYEIAELLLDHKADPNLPSPGNASRTPIELAEEDQKLTDLLIKHGAKLGVRSAPDLSVPAVRKKKRKRDRLLPPPAAPMKTAPMPADPTKKAESEKAAKPAKSAPLQ